ncbi:MAG: BlaR1 family beta-lactam sensor/signal transducer, partial [bacterium]|nr:BlaR1 family beta-lactam sensor/signal transducer [bacterium]MDY4100249.1 BlaR1 family beta-lactam sensor/signal transducer [Lachnospiraceae bacterium]
MADFMIRFLLCNVFISGIIGIFLIVKQIFKNSLSSRMQYHLWFLLLGLLVVPFLPCRLVGIPQIFLWLGSLRISPSSGTGTAIEEARGIDSTGNTDWMKDFTLSVNSGAPSIAGYILLGIWLAGMLVMMILVVRSALRLRSLETSALPLQNKEVRRLFHRCLEEMGIHRNIPVYSTAFMKSPIIVGLLKPRIYLPIHLISDYTSTDEACPMQSSMNYGMPRGYSESDMRYMLLHELQHYKHKDALAGYLMNLAVVVYWFNPLVWYALREMRNDREVACDTSVLKMLEEDEYEEYGNTLINFAEKISLTPFPFAAGLGGNMKQMKRRIINIASYEKPTFVKRLKGMASFVLTAVLLFAFAPFISTYASEVNYYQWDSSSENVSYVDLSSYFGAYEGSFVLYDLENDTWRIHDMDRAALRVAPNSTYKIYAALFALEDDVITPENTFLAWDGKHYPFDTWNSDQTLRSAMSNSVNWYFQSLNEQLGTPSVQKHLQQIKYGNENMSGDFSSFSMESSLKISPIEQVELLTKLQNNSFDFAPENVNAVKDAICLSSSDTGSFYGKTGTGRVNGQDVNGWFVGFAECADHTYFFATNIGADHDATGGNATEITMSILSDMNI